MILIRAKEGAIALETWLAAVENDPELFEITVRNVVDPRTGLALQAKMPAGTVFWMPDGENECGMFSFRRSGKIDMESNDPRAEEKARQIADVLDADVTVMED